EPVRPDRRPLDAVRRAARAGPADPPAAHRDPDRRLPHRPRGGRRAHPGPARADGRSLRRARLPDARRRMVRRVLRVGLPAAGAAARRSPGRLLAVPRAGVRRRRRGGPRALRAAEEGRAGQPRPRRRPPRRPGGPQRHRPGHGHAALEADAGGAGAGRARARGGTERQPPDPPGGPGRRSSRARRPLVRGRRGARGLGGVRHPGAAAERPGAGPPARGARRRRRPAPPGRPHAAARRGDPSLL
ncbi:MAG: Acetoacetate decarboxylase, partial [uncultured Thermoleophilia bacterium]